MAGQTESEKNMANHGLLTAQKREAEENTAENIDIEV
jgi:hypothetical protein